MFKSTIATAILAASSALAATRPEPRLPDTWVTTDELLQTSNPSTMKVKITLPSRNMHKLKDLVAEVSTPGSPAYGSHLTKEQVKDLTSADVEDVNAVLEWLSGHGITGSLSETGTTVVIEETPAKIEEVFNTQLRPVRNTETGQKAIRAGSYTIPSPAHESISAVYGLHGLPLPPRDVKASVASRPVEVNPSVLLNQYKVSGVTVSRSDKNRQAVAEFQGQNAEQSDLDLFFKEQVNSTAYQKGDEVIYKTIGTNGPNSGEEAALDIQYIMGGAPGIKTEFWGYPGSDFCGDMVQFTDDILKEANPPNVFSISYGYQGDLSKIGCSDTSAVDNNFAKIAARGISVLISSGDSGSQYTKPWFNPFSKGKLYPSWPASSPYVTAVGATRFIDQDIHKGEEASDQFGSGGGFSYGFDRTNAKYQEAAVEKYLSIVTDKPPKATYTATGRGTPDVAALGEGYIIYSSGQKLVIGGTSASAPLFAALVSLLNEARLAKNLPPLGLLNPLLYQNPDAFNDVTEGTGAVTRAGTKAKYGWDAAKGWDAVTGLGTPQFDKLLAAALKQ